MLQAHRYLLEWHSSVTGEHVETFMHPERARARLEELEERTHFERGWVVDTQTRDADEFAAIHRDYHNRVIS